MNPGIEPSDAELAELRARRARELLELRSERPSGPPPAAPTNLDAGRVERFLADNPQVVIDVWAPWCGPCPAMAPVVDELARALTGRVAFGKVNADEEPGLTMQWGVEGIPTFLLFQSGRLVDRIVGGMPRTEFHRRIERTFGRDDSQVPRST